MRLTGLHGSVGATFKYLGKKFGQVPRKVNQIIGCFLCNALVYSVAAGESKPPFYLVGQPDTFNSFCPMSGYYVLLIKGR
jgi:hypothetical protein